jgi:undecaprenyl-diphosphatase
MLRSLPRRALIQFAIAVLATLVFVALAELVLEGRADPIDRSLALEVRKLDNPILDHVMFVITQLGSMPVLAVAVIITAGWLIGTDHRRTTLILVCNLVAAQLLNAVLKLYFARPRPTLFDEITRPETFSFPSGHAMSSMAIYGGIAAVLVTHHRRRRTLIVAGAALLVATIGFSRVYLGVHWPFDVLAGFAAGVPLVMATVHLLHTRARTSS